MPPLRTAVLLVLGSLAATGASAEDLDLSLRKARAVLRPARSDRAPRHRVDLKGTFPLDVWADTFDPATERVALTIGGAEVLVLEADGDRTGLREKDAFRWLYRTPRRRGEPRVRLVLDVAFGRFNVRGRRLDLSELAAHGTEGVELRLELGAQVFSTTLDFDARGARWRLRRDEIEPPPAPPPPPVPPAPPGPLERAVVATGQTSGITGLRTVVVRTQAAWTALWAQHDRTTGAPTVDFTRDMVVGVFLGDRPHMGHACSIDSVAAEAPGGVSVVYTEGVTQGSCVIAPAVSQPFSMVRVRRVAGASSFLGRSAISICHGRP